jgi:hypothetical protein
LAAIHVTAIHVTAIHMMAIHVTAIRVKDYWSCYAFNFLLLSAFFVWVKFYEEINVVVACEVYLLSDTLKN